MGYFSDKCNEGTRTKYQFSAANYLRIAATQREDQYQDLRWFSEQTIEDKSFTVKANAKPVEIECWEGIDDGQCYEGNLRKFYNAADVVEINGIRNSNDQVFSAVKEYARKNGADEFAAPLTSQLFFKTSHLSYDYAQHPLYEEEQISKLSENPKILFYAMKKAQEIVQSMQVKQDRELKQMADKIQNRKLQ